MIRFFSGLCALIFCVSATMADISWVGGTSTDVFDESNWDLSGSSVTAIDENVNIADNVFIGSGPFANNPVIPDLGGQVRLQLDDGFTLSVDGGQIVYAGNDGVGGAPGTSNGPTVNVINGAHFQPFFVVNDVHVNVDSMSTAVFGGGGNPVNSGTAGMSTINLQPGARLEFLAETDTDFRAEHLSKILVNGAPAVEGTNLNVFANGAGSIVTAPGPRHYTVRGTATAPVIDGVIDAAWGHAIKAGNFELLREAGGTPDGENSSLAMMWDNDNLYLLFQSDYGGWNGPNGTINFSADNLNVLLDPNTDGEDNSPGGQDSYLLAFSQPSGASDAVTPFAEAHIDGNFGDQGGDWSKWGGTTIAQNNDANGGVAEVSIPWSEFNVADGGLSHPTAPSVGDEWYFNLGRISSDGSNLLPIFSHHSGQFFAERPMGVITFAPVPEPSSSVMVTLLGVGALSLRRRRRAA